MEADTVDDLIHARTLTGVGVSLAQLRRYGGNLYPDAADWYNFNRGCRLPYHAALGILLVWHLTNKRVLIESDALSTVMFYRDDVTRYAKRAWQALQQSSDERHVPIVMIEIMDGRWARLSNVRRIFDVKEQAIAENENLLAAGNLMTYSHAVCLLPLLILLRSEKNDDNDAKQGSAPANAE